jgi:hypothetical protein
MNNGYMPANVVTEEQWDRSSSAAPATGLTKREAFAMAAMQGILASKYYADFCNDGDCKGAKGAAAMSVIHADQLLIALEGDES